MSDSSRPKILVTGGTGFIGTAVVRALHEAGFSARILTRHTSKGTALHLRYGAEVVEGNIYEPSEVARACEGAQGVIHLVGIIHQTFGDPFEKVHIEATRSVLAGVHMAGIRRYVHMSALGTRADAGSQYHRSKWEAEKLVRGSGLDWTIVRPSLVFGPGDQFVNLFAKLLGFPLNALNAYTFPLLGGGQSQFQPISVEDVALAFVRSLNHESSIGQTYELCGTERLSLADILRDIAETTGQKVVVERTPLLTPLRHLLWLGCGLLPIVAVPCSVILGAPQMVTVLLVLIWLGLLSKAIHWRDLLLFPLAWPLAFAVAALLQNIWIGGQPLLTVDQLVMLKEGNVGDFQKAQDAFHLPLTPFREGIARYLGIPDSLPYRRPAPTT